MLHFRNVDDWNVHRRQRRNDRGFDDVVIRVHLSLAADLCLDARERKSGFERESGRHAYREAEVLLGCVTEQPELGYAPDSTPEVDTAGAALAELVHGVRVIIVEEADFV